MYQMSCDLLPSTLPTIPGKSEHLVLFTTTRVHHYQVKGDMLDVQLFLHVGYSQTVLG